MEAEEREGRGRGEDRDAFLEVKDLLAKKGLTESGEPSLAGLRSPRMQDADSGVCVLCAVLQGLLQDRGKDGASNLEGLKWKLRKPVCVREHRGSLSHDFYHRLFPG